MQSTELNVKRVAVLGAGVMGAQIAAHMANAGIETVLYELPATDGPKNGLVTKAIAGLKKLKPSPLGVASIAASIEPANYEEHLDLLKDCQLVIEAIAERLDWKKDLYDKVAPYLDESTLFASNTSGLSIASLAAVLPDSLQSRFCGVHFFNPPRYMELLELIPHKGTEPAVLDQLETFFTRTLGKNVVRAKDTPNFVGNRIGVFSMLATMHHTEAFGLGFDTADALTGPAIGRPKSATYRTADVVGLDTMMHVINTMHEQLEDDPWHPYFTAPAWLQERVASGALGQKTRKGVYEKRGRDILVYDSDTGDYRPQDVSLSDEVKSLLAERDPAAKLAGLRQSKAPEAQFLWAQFRDLFHYCACHLGDIADSAREIDQAIRWGYGWKLGPFELWQKAGWQEVASWISEDIEQGRAMAKTPLPQWVTDGRTGVHTDEGAYSAATGAVSARSSLPVYSRQLTPPRLAGEKRNTGTTVEENESVRLWYTDPDVLLLSFKTKMHSINSGVIEGINQAVTLAEKNYRGLVIYQPDGPFCVGADLTAIGGAVKAGNLDVVEGILDGLQQALLRLKFSSVPTIAAVRGLALGGGLEIVLQCQRVVAAFESYLGLVEAGVGLLPGGGGLKEMAFRAEEFNRGSDSFDLLKAFYQNIAMGKVSGSALEARDFGYLRPQDVHVMHAEEVLGIAIDQARSMAFAGSRPPFRQHTIPAAGDVGVASLRMLLVNMREGAFISDHDYEIGGRIAEVLSGGSVDRGTRVPEQWYLDLEREHFMALVVQEKTQERIAHMLKTGKPLRN